VKEIEEALLSGEIDLAVHSMKDVPTVLPVGLAILCVPPREDPRDALISRDGRSFKDLPHGARIGTSSLRRQSQLLHARPDLTIAMLRGNLDTRLKKLREGQFDAIVLAAAGLRRLGWAHEITEYLAPQISLPAIGQGALGIEGRRDDLFIRSLLRGLDHAPSKTAVLAERALLHRLQGGCQVPIAAHATVSKQRQAPISIRHRCLRLASRSSRMLKKSASLSSARRACLARQARLASPDSECLAFLANLARLSCRACFAHPARLSSSQADVQAIDAPVGSYSFSAAC
jgi:hydroxymethylbilane synthase